LAVNRTNSVKPRHHQAGAPVATPTEVPIAIRVTEEYPEGALGFLARVKSLLTGIGITARRAARPVKTISYPAEKLTLSDRWRGPLYLRGILGREEIPILQAESPEYNALIDSLHQAQRLAPCVGNCPANVDARGQNYFMADGRKVEAYELVRDRNIMPGVLGRICHHPCESVCRRGYYDEAVAIRPLHRMAYEAHRSARPPVRPFEPTRDQSVAIIGSGPSGLAAAWDLMKLGYKVTVYEKEKTPGGALFFGVPAYRLPRDILGDEIQQVVEHGLDLRLGIEIGKDVPIDHLIGEYDAVLIAVGLQLSRLLPLRGIEALGVRSALEFLRDSNRKNDADVKGKRVMVIGGGNVAVDVARCALRVGASEVRLACLEASEEMPCHPWEIEEALDEGVIAMCGNGPDEVLQQDGKVIGMRLRECMSVFDAFGRFAPVFGEGSTDVDCDVVVFAIGQAPELADLVSGSDLLLTENGLLPVDGTTLTTEVPKVFACGEVITGPGSAIGSIATGHEAATSIHRYLSSEDLLEDRAFRPVSLYPRYGPATLDGVELSRRRVVMPMAAPDERVKDFRPVELGFTQLESLNEAARCLRCQSEVCVGCTFCARTCPAYALMVERIDDPGDRVVTRYDFDVSKCCFCGLCAEQCPTDALSHTGQYELSFFHRDLVLSDKYEMLRDPAGTRFTGRDGVRPQSTGGRE